MFREKWKIVRDAIREDIANGKLQPGDKLPIEPELASTYGVGRHSVRRAITELAKEDKVSVEQGRGTFVESAPLIDYTIGRRTRLRRNLNSQGVDVSGELLEFGVVEATDRAQNALRLEPGAMVIKTRRLTRADKMPIAYGLAYRSADRFPDFVERRNKIGSVTKTYESYGISDYIRGETTIHSRLVRPEEAKLLQQHPDTAVMVVRAIDTEMDGTPLSFSQVIWSATRVKFTFSNDQDDE